MKCPECGVSDGPHFWGCSKGNRDEGWRSQQHKLDYSDLLNQPIKVGSYIAYAATVGQSATLRIGKIVELTSKKADECRHDYDILKVKVKAANMEFGDKPSVMIKLITLEYFHRLVVIPEGSITQEIKDLLNKTP